MFKKSDLRTGMFGIKTNGDLFIVANGMLVFQNGDFEQICEMNDNMEFKSYVPNQPNRIEKLCSAFSFNQAKGIFSTETLIYDRRIAEMEGKQ